MEALINPKKEEEEDKFKKKKKKKINLISFLTQEKIFCVWLMIILKIIVLNLKKRI